MSDDPHLPTPLAHGRWAGDRVSRSAREARASLQTNETRQLQVAAARKAAVSAFWQEQARCSPPTVQNEKQLARIAARRDFVQRELATRLPSGKKRPGVRREVASKRSRGASGHFAPSAVTASAAVVAQPAAAIAVSATAVSVATTAATAWWFVIIEASPPATLVVSLVQRPQLHGLIPRGDGDAHRAIRAEQRERIGHCAHVV